MALKQLSLLVLFVLLSTLASCKRHSTEFRQTSETEHRKQASEHSTGNRKLVTEGANPFVAFRNKVSKMTRLYGQYPHGHDGRVQEITGCSYYTSLHSTESGDQHHDSNFTLYEILSYRRESGETEEESTAYGDYWVECPDPGEQFTYMSLRLLDDRDYGRPIEITTMDTDKKGKVAACSQPLHTNREWLQDWVDHYVRLGVTKFVMNAPKGKPIDDLFNENRDERLKFNADLGERTPHNAGKERLQEFHRPEVEWFDYWPRADSYFYGEQFLFLICQYKLQYAYDYVMDFDADEFLVITPEGQKDYRDLPSLLDKEFDPRAATLRFWQVNYPLECPTKSEGPYADRFTKTDNLPSQYKIIVRPKAAKAMHVHWMLDATDEWKKQVTKEWDEWLDHVHINLAYLKHIRGTLMPGEEGKEHLRFLCS